MLSSLRQRRLRTVLGAGVLLLALGAAGIAATPSGAWFTATKTAGASVEGALMQIGEIGERDQLSIEVGDLSPMTDAQAASTAESQWITVRNRGTIPLDWTLSVVTPIAGTPLQASDLLKFRFRLFDSAGQAVSDVLRLGDMPAAATPGSIQARGTGLAAGADTAIRIAVWLATDADNTFQGTGASFSIVINALQSNGRAAAPLALTAVGAGQPAGVQTALSWNDVTPLLRESGVPGTPTYTVQRSTGASFSDATTVYSGTGLSVTDTTSGASPSENLRATQVASPRWGTSTYAIMNGSVYYWGTQKRSGGFDTARWFSVSTPTKLDGVADVTKIAAGGDHVCALTTGGSVFCAGFNSKGQLGNGSLASGDLSASTNTADLRTTAAAVGDPNGVFTGKTIVDLAAGDDFTCALTSDGTVGCWGSNSSGQIAATGIAASASPVRVSLSTSPKAISIAASSSTACVVLDPANASRGNNVKCWGYYGNQELGSAKGRVGSSSATPTAIEDPSGVLVGARSLGAGYGTFCAVTSITTATNVACWGYSSRGLLGDGSDGPWWNSSPTPQRITLAGNVQFSSVTGSYGSMCGRASGAVYCWGSNSTGQLGSGSIGDSRRLPAVVVDTDNTFRGATITSVSVSEKHACAVTSAGALSCWGSDADKQRALGTSGGTSTSVAPQLAQMTASGRTFALNGDTSACEAGAVLVGSNSCSLSASKGYFYRLTYTVSSLPGWTSPAVVATR